MVPILLLNKKYKLNLYYYDEINNKLVLEKTDLLVKNGFVEYDIEHCSEYILTKAKFIEDVKKIDYKNIIIIIETIIIVGLLSFVLIKFLKEKKVKL